MTLKGTGSTLISSSQWRRKLRNYSRMINCDKLAQYQQFLMLLIINNFPIKMMKHQSTLPMLHSSRKQSEPKKNIKVIQTKLSQHESEISKNQKFIITIANDFRLIKEQLKVKQQQNEQLSEMHRVAIEDNQKLSKHIKELKQQIIRLQKSVQEKNKLNEGNQNLINPAFLNKQKQINALNEQLIRQKQYCINLQHNIQSLTKQCEKMKKSFLESQNHSQTQLNQRIKIEMNRNDTLEQQIKKLQTQKMQLQEQGRQKDSFILKLKLHDKDTDNLNRENKRLEQEIKQLKANYQKMCNDNKKKKQQISALEEINKAQQKKYQAEVIANNKIHQLQTKQISLKQALNIKEKQVYKLNQQVRQLLSVKEANKKLESQFRKLVKQKCQVEKLIQKIGNSIKCQFCLKIASKAVTCIPCGHSFCFECKKGYEKECKKCNGVKREAVYRNELLDQIILSHQNIKAVLQILKQIN